jgi:hypothetical protein
MLLYYVDHGSCYIHIKEIIEKNEDHFVALVMWFSKPGMTLILEDVEKIPYKSFVEWKCHEVPSNLPQ